jgi:hypothetical protein
MPSAGQDEQSVGTSRGLVHRRHGLSVAARGP